MVHSFESHNETVCDRDLISDKNTSVVLVICSPPYLAWQDAYKSSGSHRYRTPSVFSPFDSRSNGTPIGFNGHASKSQAEQLAVRRLCWTSGSEAADHLRWVLYCLLTMDTDSQLLSTIRLHFVTHTQSGTWYELVESCLVVHLSFERSTLEHSSSCPHSHSSAFITLTT